MLSCSVWFSEPSCWMGGGLESSCVGRVYGADGAVHGTIRTEVSQTVTISTLRVLYPRFPALWRPLLIVMSSGT